MAPTLLDELLQRTRPAKSPFVLVRAVERGLPVKLLDRLAKRIGLTPDEQDLLIPRRTLQYRRRSKQQLLPADVSDRLVRLIWLLQLAMDTFDSADTALEWMRTSNAALENRVPLELAMTSPGARIVENTLGRIQYGIGF